MSTTPCTFCHRPMPARLVPLGADDFYLEADSLFCSPACERISEWMRLVNLDCGARAGMSIAELCERFGWARPEVGT